MPRKYPYGMAVEIVQASGLGMPLKDGRVIALADPNPQHIGKRGWIVGWTKRSGIPIIQLDDEDDGKPYTILTGAECWWQPVGGRAG